ncbi:MAG: hypothetical protein ACJ77K_03665 [Bacteroidia bacterium]
MSRFKERSQGFLVGIMVGLIVAGGFFILKLDDYFKELNFYKTLANSFSSETKEQPVPAKPQEPVNVEKNKKTEKVKSIAAVEADDEDLKVVVPDTTIAKKDTLVLQNPELEDGVVIRKDELLSTKTLEVVNLDPVAKMTQKDSLLQKVSGVKDDRFGTRQYFNLEFWSSPLNYKGYRMSKYKLILYGIASADGLKLFKADDVVYMKSAGLVYRLDPTGDFKPYERITDENIISRLK